MKYAFMLIILGVLSSCCGLHTEIKYSYKDIVITRIDECGETSFYYGEPGENNGRIWIKYAGISSGFDGYLIFDSLGKVSFIRDDGYFESENVDTSLFQISSEFIYDNPDIGDSVCYFNLGPKTEQKRNHAEGSGIKVEYQIDDNVWW